MPIIPQRRNGAEPRAGVLAWIERRLGLAPAGLFVLGVAAIGIWLGRWLESRGMLLAAYGLLVVVLLAWLAGRRKLNVQAHRSALPSRVRQGMVIDAQLELTARQRLATVILEEDMHPRLGSPVRVPVPVLPSGKAVTHAYQVGPKFRGIYEVGPMVIEWSDPFGLTRRRQRVADPQKVIVHPRLEPLVDRIDTRAWEDPPIRPPISKPWPTGFEFYGMREYVYGDDPRRIVWRALAQYDKYLVRESEQGITDRVNIAVDTNRASHSPGDVSQTFEAAVSVVASLVAKHLKDGFSVTVDRNSGNLVDHARSRSKTIPILDDLAGLQRDAAPFTDALNQLHRRIPRGAHNIVVTPHLSNDVARRLRILTDSGAHLLLVLVLWEDTDPATIHRAGLLRCQVAEIHPRAALGRAFKHAVGARTRLG